MRQCMRTRRLVVSSSYSDAAHERVGERVPTGRARRLADQAELRRLVERVEQLVARRAARALDRREVERRADHRADREGLVHRVGQPGEPPADDLAHALGDAEVGDRARGGPAPVVVLHDRAGLGEVAQHLTDEERVALGLGVQRRGEIPAALGELVTGDVRHEAGDLVLVEALEVEAVDAGLAPEVAEHVRERMAAVEVGVAVRAEEEHAHRRRRPEQVTEQDERRLVGPVQVVEHEHHGRRGRDLGEQVGDRVEQPEALGLGVGHHRLGEAGDATREVGDDAHELAAERADLGAHLIGRRDEHVVTQRLGERTVRARRGPRRSGPRARSTRGRARARTASVTSRVLPMPGSPDTSTARRAPSAVSFHAVVRISSWSMRPENGNAGFVSTNAGSGVAVIWSRELPDHLARGDRLGEALELERAERPELEVGAAARERAHELAREDLAAVGRRAEPGGLDDRRAEPVAVLEARVAGADADPHRDRLAVGEPAIVAVDRPLHRGRAGERRRRRPGTRPSARRRWSSPRCRRWRRRPPAARRSGRGASRRRRDHRRSTRARSSRRGP